MMDPIFILSGAILVLIFIVVFLFFKLSNSGKSDIETRMLMEQIDRMRQEIAHGENQSREALQGRLDKVMEQVSKHQTDTTTHMQEQYKDSRRMIAELTEKLTQIESTNQKVISFAEQMRSLERILQHPKQRGILGEYFLESLLSQVFAPEQYKLQYKIDDGAVVDAAIFFKDKIIPVDAKFSLEKYNRMMQTDDPVERDKLEVEFRRDVKGRIDETSKYVLPEKGTTDFAFMFIPAEGIYYNLLIYNVGSTPVNTHDLVEYAFHKRVIIVSPTSFYAYLETVMQGLRQLKVERSIQDVIKNVKQLTRHLQAYEEHFEKVGKHLGTTVNSYNKSAQEFKKIDKDILKISGENESQLSEMPELQRPDERPDVETD